jgi:hypothetical protein
MSGGEPIGAFADFDPAEYEDEARARWGDSAAYRESVRRTASYTRADWERLAAESGEIYAAFVALKEAGVPPESDEAMDVAERHRAHIGDWFYPCSPETHVGLGEMYVRDARFTENIDRHGAGLAAYMSTAILANGVRLAD